YRDAGRQQHAAAPPHRHEDQPQHEVAGGVPSRGRHGAAQRSSQLLRNGDMLNRLRHEDGMALVLALLTMTVLTITATSVILYSTSGEHQSSYSKAADQSYRLAETGINNAMATLGNTQTSALDSNALPGSEATSSSQTYSTGTAKWWGTLNTSTRTWTLY